MTSEKRAQKFHTDDASPPRAGWCFWLVESNFLRGTINQKHYPNLGSDVSSVWNFCLISQKSFGGKTSGSVAKCRLFSQATWSSTKTVIWEYYGIFSQRPIKPRMANLGDGPGGPQSSTHIIFNPNWNPKAKKKLFSRPGAPSYLRVWMTAPFPPPHSLKKREI